METLQFCVAFESCLPTASLHVDPHVSAIAHVELPAGRESPEGFVYMLFASWLPEPCNAMANKK